MSDTYAVTFTPLLYQDVRSDKFYHVYVLEGTEHPGVLMHYGRQGTHGQESWHPTNTAEDASVFFNRKVFEKRDKGYQVHGEGKTFPYETLGHEPSVVRLQDAIRKHRREENTDDSGKPSVTEFESKVSGLLASIKRDDRELDELVATLVVLEMELLDAEDAIANAKLGLEMARTAVGRKVTA